MTEQNRPRSVDDHEARNPRPGHRLAAAALAVPLAALTGLFGVKPRKPVDDTSLSEALSGERRVFSTDAGRLSYYAAGPAPDDQTASTTPLLLIHSINAAGSAYEMRPLYEALKRSRPVYALELPGYGFSERPAILYLPRLMTDAILAMVDEIRRRHGEVAIDAMALSLSSEFLARAAVERHGAFRTIALVSPTGFDNRGPRNGAPGSNRGMPALYKTVTVDAWRRGLFHLLTSRISIRYFLEKTWGSKAIDEGLLEYDYRTTHQPGAEHAPYSFISGFLFSNDISRIYASLDLPVWLLHGTRGDFVDYRGTHLIESRPNWTIDIMDTGALPQFEKLDPMLARYEAVLSAQVRLQATPEG